MELADKRNSIPLPPVSNEYGVRLPPLQYQLVTKESDRQDTVGLAAERACWPGGKLSGSFLALWSAENAEHASSWRCKWVWSWSGSPTAHTPAHRGLPQQEVCS